MKDLRYIGYEKAKQLVLENVGQMPSMELKVFNSGGYCLCDDTKSCVDSPSVDASLKDGFAVHSSDLAGACKDNPVTLKLKGFSAAGVPWDGKVDHGHGAKIMTGGAIPDGADAVVASEFCIENDQGQVMVLADAEAGKNILLRGTDNSKGQVVVGAGTVLTPGMIGALTSSGIENVEVVARPKVAIVAVGDELVAPGGQLKEGQLYASNLVTLGAWLDEFGFDYSANVVVDEEDSIRAALNEAFADADAVLTSGGAWGSQKDLVIALFNELTDRQFFRRVRMGPGKGVAFGLKNNKPLFCLPGGPSSNEIAFLQLALPGLLKMSGDCSEPFGQLNARLSKSIKGRELNWTQFHRGQLGQDESGFTVSVDKKKSRLNAIASADCLVRLCEGVELLEAGSEVQVQVLQWHR